MLTLRVSWIWHTIESTLPFIKFYFLSAAVFTALEFLIPADRTRSPRNSFANLQFTLLYILVTPFAMILPSAFAAAVTQRFRGGLIHWDLDRLALGIPALDWTAHNLLLPLIPLFIFDFFYYWHHRLQHVSPAFWPVHRLHHSMESLNAIGTLRIHWLEEPMRALTITIPMSLLFNIGPVRAAAIGFALSQWAMFAHSNLRIPLGPFTGVLTGPQLHRLHHSLLPEHQDKNFTSMLPLWDILFGTYVGPKKGEWPATGLAGGEHPRGTLYETAWPFVTWGRACVRRLPSFARPVGQIKV